MNIDLRHGDAIEILKTFPDSSIDAVVADPPYGLSKQPDMTEVLRHWLAGDDYIHRGGGFMGKTWDSFVPGPSIWKECLRVLKPGGHLLSFFGSRTYDLGTLAIRLAGFEIRDQIMWVYGSGFPKSMDVSKAIDKAAGAEREVVGPGKYAARKPNGAEGVNTDYRLHGSGLQSLPATLNAQQWEGWGTALKPAHEPICVARKPLIGTVAQNVLEHGTGAINVDGCRVPHVTVGDGSLAYNPHLRDTINGGNGGKIFPSESERRVVTPDPQGRWPANLVHDGSDEVEEAFSMFGEHPGTRIEKPSDCNTDGVTSFQSMRGNRPARGYADTGSAARFFYCAKASKKDRGEGNDHPTVKPTALMQWLVRLVTPPGGTVLDPFVGSGSTGKAAVLEGFSFIGIDQDEAYIALSRKRIDATLAELAAVAS